jgi:hypothetical protein
VADAGKHLDAVVEADDAPVAGVRLEVVLVHDVPEARTRVDGGPGRERRRTAYMRVELSEQDRQQKPSRARQQGLPWSPMEPALKQQRS